MKRFFGMMPLSEIEYDKTFKVGENKLEVSIQAGKRGWTIIYTDASTEYQDIEDTAENNFMKAYDVLKSHFSKIYIC